MGLFQQTVCSPEIVIHLQRTLTCCVSCGSSFIDSKTISALLVSVCMTGKIPQFFCCLVYQRDEKFIIEVSGQLECPLF